MDQDQRDIEEYKALRSEVLAAINAMLSIVSFLLVALAALLGVAIKVITDEKDLPLAIGIFGLLAPAVSWFGIWLWLGETLRLRRASFYLSLLERDLGLRWECWLRAKSGRIFIHNHEATFAFFAISGLLSFLCGTGFLYSVLYRSFQSHPDLQLFARIVYIVTGLAVVATLACWSRWSYRRWNLIRNLEKEVQTDPTFWTLFEGEADFTKLRQAKALILPR